MHGFPSFLQVPEGSYLVGMKVSKEFNGECYAGVVDSFNGSHFRILYDDDDSEELSEDDVTPSRCLRRRGAKN